MPKYSWWGNSKRPAAALFTSLFCFLTVWPFRWGSGGAGTPTGAAAVPLRPSAWAPNAPQMRPPIYPWPRLTGGMLGEHWDTAVARPVRSTSFNKRQLGRSEESVRTRQRPTSPRGRRLMTKAWWSASGRHYYRVLLANIQYTWQESVLLPCYNITWAITKKRASVQ